MKINVFRNFFFIAGICLLSSIGFGQTTFKNQYLKTLNDIANSSFSSVLKLMKERKYILDDKGVDSNDGGVYFVFTGKVDQELMVSYSKSKELVFIAQDLLTLNLVFCEMELQDKGFTKLSATKEKEDGINITITKWGKSGYPYRYVLHQSEDKVSQLTLQSKISSGY